MDSSRSRSTIRQSLMGWTFQLPLQKGVWDYRRPIPVTLCPHWYFSQEWHKMVRIAQPTEHWWLGQHYLAWIYPCRLSERIIQTGRKEFTSAYLDMASEYWPVIREPLCKSKEGPYSIEYMLSRLDDVYRDFLPAYFRKLAAAQRVVQAKVVNHT